MNIPKIIYQTWKTKNLHPNVQQIRNNIQILNPDYKIILFDDTDMDNWINENCEQYIINAYNMLYNGAAKADLWRYLIIYKNGGIYLDIDSSIDCSLDLLIQTNDSAVISREGNKGYFLQWLLIFEKEHPILKSTIDKCIYNINNKTHTDVVFLTGPGVFTEAINETYPHIQNMWDMDDDELNKITNHPKNIIRSTYNKISYNYMTSWKHSAHELLYVNEIYWREQPIYK
jgi:mannosyltransferase OCH1-like enzyme